MYLMLNDFLRIETNRDKFDRSTISTGNTFDSYYVFDPSFFLEREFYEFSVIFQPHRNCPNAYAIPPM